MLHRAIEPSGPSIFTTGPRISRGHPSFSEVNFFYPAYRCVTIGLSFQNPETPMARINRREGNACGVTHPDAWLCNEIAINCSVDCHKKDGWPRLNSFSYISTMTSAGIPYDVHGCNSNWALSCSLRKCGLAGLAYPAKPYNPSPCRTCLMWEMVPAGRGCHAICAHWHKFACP